MPKILRRLLALGVLLLLVLTHPAAVDGHAAFVRSEPMPGVSLDEPPEEVQIWFAEPLEPAFSRATLLDSSGATVPGATSSVAGSDTHLLVLTLPAPLPDGAYTVAWRNVSAADGHSLEGYFGFRVGTGPVGGGTEAATGAMGSEISGAIARWLALLGLAALIAIAPVTLTVLDPAGRASSLLAAHLDAGLRRYSIMAAGLAGLGSVLALAAQAATIAPDTPLPAAVAQTLADTRYGRLWLWRLGLLLLCIVLVATALWGRRAWRRSALLLAMASALGAPLPFSLLSHAAAQTDGRAAAIASDWLHLLAAAIWAGGLVLLVLVLTPALWRAPAGDQRAALQSAVPRFSVIGLASWGVLTLSGLYAAWLQVGTIDALRDTPYGQTLLLKGILLIPVLALAAFHLLLGWRGVTLGDAARAARTIAAEALLVVAVLLAVGRLIGLEPAREVVASQNPTSLAVPLRFATEDGERSGQLAVSPGMPGPNTFTLEIEGAALPEGSEGVLRFSLPSQDIGEEELLLPAAAPNRFRAEGPELTLSGDWQVQAIVRQIGGFSWSTQATIPLRDTPPAAPEANPAPHFAAAGIAGMIAIAMGLAGLAAGIATRTAPRKRRLAVATIGAALAIFGSITLAAARLPVTSPLVAAPQVAATAEAGSATPGAASSPEPLLHDHSPATAGTPVALAGPGTPVAAGGLTVTIAASPGASGSIDVTATIAAADGAPLTGARVVVLSEMPEMGGEGAATPAAETAPGHYRAKGVDLGMAGLWHIAVRVSPKSQPTQVALFAIDVP